MDLIAALKAFPKPLEDHTPWRESLWRYKSVVIYPHDGDTWRCLLDFGFGHYDNRLVRLKDYSARELDEPADETRMSGYDAWRFVEDLLEPLTPMVLSVDKSLQLERYVATCYILHNDEVIDLGPYLLDNGVVKLGKHSS